MTVFFEKLIDFIKVALFVAVFVGLPGLMLQRLLFRSRTYVCEDLGLAFTLGAGVFVPYALLCYTLQWPLAMAVYAYLALIVLLAIAFLAFGKGRLFPDGHPITTRYDRTYFIFLALVLFLFRNLACVDVSFSGDIWYHLAQVRYLVDGSVIKNVFPFLPREIPQWMYPYSSYYLLLAAIAKITQTDVIRAWQAMGLVLTVVFLSSTLLFFRTLLARKDAALLAVGLFFLPFLYFTMVSGVGGLSVIQNICYPKVGSLWIFLPVLSTCLLLYVQGQIGVSGMVAAAVIAVGFQNWHVVNAMFIGILAAAWFIGFLLTRQLAYLPKLVLYTAAVAFIPLILFFALDYQLIESVKHLYHFDTKYLNPEWYGAARILEEIEPGRYITKASYFFTFGDQRIQPWMLMGSLVLPVAIVVYVRNRTIRAFLGGFTLLPLLLAYNPYPVYIMVNYGAPFLVRRFLFILPIAYAFAFSFLWIYEYGVSNAKSAISQRRWFNSFLAGLLIIIACFPYLAPSKNTGMFDPRPRPELLELKEQMAAHIPLGAVVLADMDMSQAVNALRWVRIITSTKHLMVAMAPQHEVRAQDLNTFFSKAATAAQRSAIAEKYGAGYVIVQRGLIEGIDVEGFKKVFMNDAYELWARG